MISVANKEMCKRKSTAIEIAKLVSEETILTRIMEMSGRARISLGNMSSCSNLNRLALKVQTLLYRKWHHH